VLDSNSQPIVGALVTAQTTAKAVMAAASTGTAYTDAAGDYTINGLAGGTYSLTAQFGVTTIPLASSVKVGDTAAPTVTVDPVPAPAGVTAYTVSGTVTLYNSSQALTGVSITLTQLYEPGHVTTVNGVSTPDGGTPTGITYATPVTTGSDGRFNLSVTPGYYKLTPALTNYDFATNDFVLLIDPTQPQTLTKAQAINITGAQKGSGGGGITIGL
jgi:hypothetical protein